MQSRNNTQHKRNLLKPFLISAIISIILYACFVFIKIIPLKQQEELIKNSYTSQQIVDTFTKTLNDKINTLNNITLEAEKINVDPKDIPDYTGKSYTYPDPNNPTDPTSPLASLYKMLNKTHSSNNNVLNVYAGYPNNHMISSGELTLTNFYATQRPWYRDAKHNKKIHLYQNHT